MSGTKKREKQGQALTLMEDIRGIGSVILVVGSLISGTLETPIGLEYRIPALIAGAFGFLFYTKSIISDWIIEQVINSKKMGEIKKNWKTEQGKLGERITHLEGWKEAANHFLNKKGVRRAIDPITFFMVIMLIILIILMVKGKI